MKILLIILFLFCVYVFYIKQSVVTKRNQVLKAYASLDIVLQEQYRVIKMLISIINNNNLPQKALADYSDKLISESISLGTKAENIDRRIAYDKELTKVADQIADEINGNYALMNNQELKSAADEYTKCEQKLKVAIDKYNTEAHILRTAVDIFPSSFIARLSKIKYFDSI